MLNIAYLLYIFVLVFAPVALGATHVWAKMVVEAASFLALFLLLIDSWRSNRPLCQVPALVPGLAFVAWIGLQLVPLPSALLAWISPATHALYATLHGPAEPSFWAPLTIKPQYTVQELFRFASFVAVYILTVQLLADRQRLRQTLSIVLALAGLLAFQGIIQAFAGNGRILWLFDAGPNSFFGTFFYRNHYAGYMAMLLPLALALFLYYRPQAGYDIPLRQKIVHLLEQLKQSPSFRYGLIAILIFSSILLSQSRAGIIIAVLTTGAMLLVSRKLFRLNRTSPALIALLVVLALLFAGRTGMNKVDARFGEALNIEGLTHNGKTLSGRTGAWQDSGGIISDFPLTGTGMGTFFAIYPGYNLSKTHTPRQAHNDYIEMTTDGGLIAIGLIAAFLFLFFRQNFGLYRLRNDSYARHLYLGSLTGILALLLHSITEYQFRQTSAVPLCFFFLLGVHTVAIHSRRTTTGSPTLLPVADPGRPITTACCSALLLLLAGATLFHSGEMIGLATFKVPEVAATNLFNLSADADQDTLLLQHQLALRATGYDPLNPIYPTAVAYTAQFLELDDKADQAYRQALSLDPANANTLQLYGEFLSGQGKGEDAQRLLLASVQRDTNSQKRLLFYVFWLLGQGETEKGVIAARDMLDQYPELAPSFLAMIDNSPLPPEIIPQSLPERVAPRLAYAALLEKKGELELASATYDLALSTMDKEEIVTAAFFQQPYRFFTTQKDPDRALAVLQQAVFHLPNEFGLRLQLGDLYASQGMHRKAAEEYRSGLQLKPNDPQIQQRLETITAVLGQ